MKLHLEINGMRVNFEADRTSGDEVAVLAKLRALLFDLAGFENVALSVNTYSVSSEESPVIVDTSINPQAAWPFPTEIYEDLIVLDDEEVPAESTATDEMQEVSSNAESNQ